MKKTTISLCFIIIFTMFLAAPLVITVMDKSFDISMFYGINEEENNNNYEIKHKQIAFPNYDNSELLVLELQKKKQFDFYLNHYSQLSLETHSPPPDCII